MSSSGEQEGTRVPVPFTDPLVNAFLRVSIQREE